MDLEQVLEQRNDEIGKTQEQLRLMVDELQATKAKLEEVTQECQEAHESRRLETQRILAEMEAMRDRQDEERVKQEQEVEDIRMEQKALQEEKNTFIQLQKEEQTQNEMYSQAKDDEYSMKIKQLQAELEVQTQRYIEEQKIDEEAFETSQNILKAQLLASNKSNEALREDLEAMSRNQDAEAIIIQQQLVSKRAEFEE